MKKINLLAAVLLGLVLATGIVTGCATTSATSTTSSSTSTKKEPEDPPNVKFVKKLQAKLNEGDTKGAIECFNTIPKSLEGDTDLKLLLGSLYISDADYDNAIAVGNDLLLIDQNNIEAQELISIAQRAKGDKKAYKASLDAILTTDPYNASANIQKAEDYALNKKWKLARECYRKAMKGDNTNTDAIFGYAQMSYYCNDVDIAKQGFQDILNKDPENAAALAYLGKIAAEEENYLKASKYVSEALKYDPKNYDYWIDYGNDLRYQGKYNDAITAWEKAVELDPTYFLAYTYLAGIYDEQDKYDDALNYYIKVIETNPKYYYAYEEIAILAYHLGKYEDAIKYFNKTYEYSNSYAYKLMVCACYQKLGNKTQTKTVLAPVLKALNKDSVEYSLVRFWSESYSKNAESSLLNKISKEENSNKRGKMLFYMGLYYELNNFEEMSNEYYAKITSMQAPMFFEYRIAEWGLKK